MKEDESVKEPESKPEKKKRPKKKQQEVVENFNEETRQELETRIEAYLNIVQENDAQIQNLQTQLDESNQTNGDLQSLVGQMREKIQELERPKATSETQEEDEEMESMRNQIKILSESLDKAQKELSEVGTPIRQSEGLIQEERSIENA